MHSGKKLIVGALLLYAVACGGGMEAALVLEATPRTFPASGVARINVTAFTPEGTIGTGSVRLTSTAGSLVDGVDLPLDGYGTATVDLSCPSSEMGCLTTVTVNGTWETKDGVVEAQVRINAATNGGGAGGSGGTGGGSGTGGASGTTWRPRNVCSGADGTIRPGLGDCCTAGAPLCTSIIMLDGATVSVNFIPPGQSQPGQPLTLRAVAPPITDANCGVTFGIAGAEGQALTGAAVAVGTINEDKTWTVLSSTTGTSLITVPTTICAAFQNPQADGIFLAVNFQPNGGSSLPVMTRDDGDWRCYPDLVNGGAGAQPTQYIAVIRK